MRVLRQNLLIAQIDVTNLPPEMGDKLRLRLEAFLFKQGQPFDIKDVRVALKDDLPIPPETLKIRIHNLDRISQRTRNRLTNAGISTIDDLLQRTEEDLRQIPLFGNKSLQEVIKELDRRGLKLHE